MAYADATDREAAWFTSVVGGLPNLLASGGGKFDVVQAYIPRVVARNRALFIERESGTEEDRISWGGKKIFKYRFVVYVYWPTEAVSGSLETEKRNLDAALDDVFSRIRDFLGDKTHGGRFQEVGEAQNDPQPSVRYMPFKQGDASLVAEIRYTARDEFVA